MKIPAISTFTTTSPASSPQETNEYDVIAIAGDRPRRPTSSRRSRPRRPIVYVHGNWDRAADDAKFAPARSLAPKA
jgi:predicted phosphodiesterase